MESRPRIALLIDADNSSARKIDLILNELSGFGETNIRRAYGNWTKSELKGWAAVLHEHAIRPVQQYDYSSGKNASDMAMVVDAMELLYTDHPEAFGIVSSDADFTPLVMHLRAKGAAVYGFGGRKTPAPFKSACSRFVELDQLTVGDDEDDVAEPTVAPTRRAPAKRASTKAAAPEKAVAATEPAKAEPVAEEPAAAKEDPASSRSGAAVRVPTAQLRQDAKLIALLRRAVKGAAHEDGWAPVGSVGQLISNQSSFDARNYGYASLSKLLDATDFFEFRDRSLGAMAVRDKRASAR